MGFSNMLPQLRETHALIATMIEKETDPVRKAEMEAELHRTKVKIEREETEHLGPLR